MKNAEIPYKSLDNQPLETRIFALTHLYHAIEKLDILNGGQKSDDEIEKIRWLIKKFVNDTMNATGENAEENIKIIDEFPELLDIADASRESGHQLTKAFLTRQKGQALLFDTDYRVLAKGTEEDVLVKIEKINTLILKAELNNSKSKNAYGSETDLAHRIVTNSWDNEDELNKIIQILQQIREKIKIRLSADWQEYKKSASTRLDIIEEEIASIIKDKFDVKYSDSKNSDKVKEANDFVRSFFSKRGTAARPSSKEAFLMMMGTLMQNGQDILHEVKTDANNHLKWLEFKKILRSQYCDDSEEDFETILNNTLKINQKFATNEEAETARRKAFQKLSVDLYIKSIGGFLTKKDEQLKGLFMPADYVQNCISRYIRSLREGKNNVLHLGLIDSDAKGSRLPSASEWDHLAENKRELIESQISSVHHKRPIASAITLYMLLNEKKYANQNPEMLDIYELKNIGRKAQELVNLLGNYALPIGSDVHAALEPHGYYAIEDRKDNTILASRFDKAKVKKFISRLNLPENVKNNYLNAINNCGAPDEKGIYRVEMLLPDHKEIDNIRSDLLKQTTYLPTRKTLSGFINRVKKMITHN